MALIRPAMLMFPEPPIPPGPPADAPKGVPYPVDIAIPPYPANAIGAAWVLMEVDVDESGAVTSAKVVGETTGFDDAALSAARDWRFRPARHDGQDVPARAYLLFAFRQPV